MRILGYARFWFNYQLLCFGNWLFKKKKNDYLMILIGGVPETLVGILEPLLAKGNDFTYGYFKNTLSVQFQSEYDFHHIDECLKASSLSDVDHYVLFKRTRESDDHYIFVMHLAMYTSLYLKPTKLSLHEKLDNLHLLILDINEKKREVDDRIDNFLKIYGEGGANGEEDDFGEIFVVTTMFEEIEDPNELNELLDKINKNGYDKLTEEEKIRLAKISKK